jgi:hypothetical protein
MEVFQPTSIFTVHLIRINKMHPNGRLRASVIEEWGGGVKAS